MLTYTRNSKQAILHATRVCAVTRVCLAYTITVNATQEGITMDTLAQLTSMLENNSYTEFNKYWNDVKWSGLLCSKEDAEQAFGHYWQSVCEEEDYCNMLRAHYM